MRVNYLQVSGHFMMRGDVLTSLVVCHHGLTVRFLERRIRMLFLRPGKFYWLTCDREAGLTPLHIEFL